MSVQDASQATVRRQLHAGSLLQLPEEAALNPALSGGASEYDQFVAIRDSVVETVNGKPRGGRLSHRMVPV